MKALDYSANHSTFSRYLVTLARYVFKWAIPSPFCLFSVISNNNTFFTANTFEKLFNAGARIHTHDLLNMSLLLKPLITRYAQCTRRLTTWHDLYSELSRVANRERDQSWEMSTTVIKKWDRISAICCGKKQKKHLSSSGQWVRLEWWCVYTQKVTCHMMHYIWLV